MTHDYPIRTPELDLVTQLHVKVDNVLELGKSTQGQRRFIPITGGTFSGKSLNGRVLPGGGDWQTIRPDGVAVLEARYFLETDTGDLIEVTNTGYRHGPAAVIEKLQRGETVNPEDYYFQTTPRFSTASQSYAWLNRTVFLGASERTPSSVIINVFAAK